ncbi:adenine phosphoribosyltransferase [Alphaproteobacteria bacterium]|nr:adenine phosphoribosyltransferase [Alphaproteobacteria bacterium]
MNRSEFYDFFGDRAPIILPVIHVIDHDQTASNIKTLIDAGISGCFLINHDFGVDKFLPIIRSIRSSYKDFWIGLNFLAVTGRDAFPILASLAKQGCRIDAYWADDARIDECEDQQIEADEIQNIRHQTGWNGLYFGGTAFKKQREVNPADYAKSAEIAGGFMDVVTTSGIATGNAPEINKVATFRSALPDTPIALASGITPENATDYAMVDCFMVATGINITDDFYNIDPAKLDLLISKCHKMGSPQ